MNMQGLCGERIEENVHKINVWYDLWDTKVWWVTLYNSTNDQIGESASLYHKRDALKEARNMVKSVKRDQGIDTLLQIFDRTGHLIKEEKHGR